MHPCEIACAGEGECRGHRDEGIHGGERREHAAARGERGVEPSDDPAMRGEDRGRMRGGRHGHRRRGTRPASGGSAEGRRASGEKAEAGDSEARARPRPRSGVPRPGAPGRGSESGDVGARRPRRRKERRVAKRRGSRSRKCGAEAGVGASEARGEEAPARESVATVVWKTSPPTLRVTTEEAIGKLWELRGLVDLAESLERLVGENESILGFTG